MSNCYCHPGRAGGSPHGDLAIAWQQSIAKTIDNDIVAGHKYNLCPVYGTVYRELELLSGSGINMDSVLAMLQKLQDLLTFDVKMKLDVSSHVKNGTSVDATWTGKAKLKLKLKAVGNKTCYSPELEGGRQIAMTVDSFQMVSDTDGPIELTSPRAFNMPIGFIQLNLCDQQPLLQLPLVAGNIPQETLTAKGHAIQTSLLQTYLSAVVQANHTNKPKVNAMTGKSPQASSEAESADGSALAPLMPAADNEPLAPLVPPSNYPSNDTPNDPIKNAMQDLDQEQQDAELKAAQAAGGRTPRGFKLDDVRGGAGRQSPICKSWPWPRLKRSWLAREWSYRSRITWSIWPTRSRACNCLGATARRSRSMSCSRFTRISWRSISQSPSSRRRNRLSGNSGAAKEQFDNADPAAYFIAQVMLTHGG
jgi:hypothetical protein